LVIVQPPRYALDRNDGTRPVILFPAIDLNDPLAGFKIMWNYEQNPYIIDNTGTTFINELVDSKGEVQATYTNLWRRMTWLGRLYLDPKPVVPHNPPLHHSNLLGPLSLPQRHKGTMLLSLSYLSPDMPDDTYMYIPQLHRVKRLGIANRGDSVWGTDFDIDSYWGFNAKLGYWTFRVLAEKEILAVVESPLSHLPTRSISDGARRLRQADLGLTGWHDYRRGPNARKAH